MKGKDLLQAMGEIDARHVRRTKVFYRRGPGWRQVVRSAARFAVTAATLVLAVGLIFGAWWLQASRDLSPRSPGEEAVTLRVLTEACAARQLPDYRESKVLDAIRNVARYFESRHKNVTVKIEVLPTEEKARQAALQRYRGEILAGNGPDLYLMPCGTLPDEEGFPVAELLFPEVRTAMEQGLFADITDFYEGDEDLQKESLHPQVMEAGVAAGNRYVLPLGFNLPVVMCLSGEQTTSRPELFALYREILEEGSSAKAKGALAGLPGQLLDLLPSDQENGGLSLSVEDCLELYELRRSLRALSREVLSQTTAVNLAHYVNGTGLSFGFSSEKPLAVGELAQSQEAVGIAKSLGLELQVLPLAGADGALTAQVAYWGAVDSRCREVRTAYELLRLFLTREVQLGQALGGEFSTQLYSQSQPVFGWPVWVEGSVEALWHNAVAYSGGEDYQRKSALRQVVLEDGDLAALRAAVDRVIFPGPPEQEFGELLQEAEGKDLPAEQFGELMTAFLDRADADRQELWGGGN